MSRGGGAFLAGLVVGALAGAAVGVLLAPRSGKETREALMDNIAEMEGPGPGLLRQVGGAIRRRFEIGRVAFVEGKEEARVQLERELQRAQGVSP
jgi:hypothetical protein